MPLHRERGRVRARWSDALKPDIDEARAGIGLIALLFGLALGLAFAQTLNGYQEISAAGWGHLGVATTAIVLSWVGYHNSRQRGLWMMKFVNRPFLQYFVDFLIVTTYWALVVTAEGIPPVPGATTADALRQPSLVPESLLVFIMLAFYSVWDALEISINGDDDYVTAREKFYEKRPEELDRILRVHAGDRARSRVTHLYLALAGVIFAIAWGLYPTDSVIVACLDLGLAIFLIAFRLHQTWAASDASPPGGLEVS